jgi:hypothetical protein
MSIDPGFRTENVALLTLSLPPSSYPQSADRAAVLDRLRERLVVLPGVETALINPGVPAGSAFLIEPALETEAGVLDADLRPTYLTYNVVDPEFFDALGVRIVAGRPFNAEDAGTSNRIIDRRLANLLWGDASPIGQTYRTGPTAGWSTVVGVVDLRLMGPDYRTAGFSSLVPRRPDQAPAFATMAVLTDADPRSLFPAIRAAVHEIDPRQPIERLRLASDEYVESIALPRFLLVILSLLAAIALALVLIGIHGLVSYQIIQRRREIGVRIALGATLRRLSLDVAGEGMLIVALACVAGIGAALAGGEVIRSLLYGVEPSDPLTLAGALAVVLLTATLACLRPVFRASRTDVVEALRVD